jgi:hypothetical protein
MLNNYDFYIMIVFNMQRDNGEGGRGSVSIKQKSEGGIQNSNKKRVSMQQRKA